MNHGNGFGDEEEQQQGRATAGGGGGNFEESNELNETQKLQLAERANEIYRQQLKYMQDHLASLRSLIQDKENIIENLMLRYDLGIITQDVNRQNGNLGADEIEQTELRRKAEALAQRTILENFELREMVNELRDENFHLRNEIYELQDKINRQVLAINKLEKKAQASALEQAQNEQENAMNGYQYDDPDPHDMYADIEDEADELEDSDLRGHKRRESTTMEHPAETEEAQRLREERAKKHIRKESTKPPDMFGDGQSDSEDYMDDDAVQKRQERANKTRKESVATPDIYGTGQGDSEEEEFDDPPAASNNNNKRRGSQVYMDEAALAKRKARQEKHANDKSQINSPEAVQKRLMRKAKKVGAAAVKHVKSHRRKESLAEKLLLGPMMMDDDELDLMAKDPEERKKLQEKARKEQRRKSRQFIKSQVGDKGHLSDDDKIESDDKPQRNQLKNRKKLKAAARVNNQPDPEEFTMPNMSAMNKKRPSVGTVPIALIEEDNQKKKHRRDSSTPIVDIGFNDPDVLLHYEQLKVQDLENELGEKIDKLKAVEKEYADIKAQVEKQTRVVAQAKQEKEAASLLLLDAVDSKTSLASKCAMEIMRLTMILNTLQQHPKLKSVVQTLLEESSNNTNKNGVL